MLKTIRHGDSGTIVLAAKILMGSESRTSDFDADFVAFTCTWQRNHDLEPDGVIGPKTWAKIAETLPTCSTAKNKKSDYVYALQLLLGTTKADGVFGPNTKAAVAAFQSANGLVVDGVCGPKTWAALLTGAADKVSAGTLVPVSYKQYDSRWADCVYTSVGNKSQTIRNSGCGTTCAAMVIATFWNKKITPKDTSKEAVQKGYRTADSGTSANYFRYIADKYGAKRYVPQASWATVESCLKAGGLCIVNVGPSVWTKGGHYILLYRIDGQTVYIHDPASAAANRAKNTYKTLKNATKGCYCIWP